MKKKSNDKIKLIFLLLVGLGVILGVIYSKYPKIFSNQAAERKKTCRNSTCRISRCKSNEEYVGDCGPFTMPNGSTDYGVCCKSR